MKMALFLLYFMLPGYAVSQNGIYVPDPALREALRKQGLMKDDTIFPQDGLLQLDISNSGIRDLTGIQVFKNVWRLDCSGNEITQLNVIPPRLTQLYCMNNKIEILDIQRPALRTIAAENNRIRQVGLLPEKLEFLNLSNNLLENIDSLPNTLKSLIISNCQFKKLPQIPEKVSFLNYYGNPLDTFQSTKIFKNNPCKNEQENCLPLERMKWNLFGLPSERFSVKAFERLNIISVQLHVSFGWGFGSESYNIQYKRNEELFVSTKSTYQYSGRYNARNEEPTGAKQVDTLFQHHFEAVRFCTILSNLMLPKFQVNNDDFGYNKSKFYADLSLLPRAAFIDGISSSCEDCSHYNIEINLSFVDGKKKTLKLDFDEGFDASLAYREPSTTGYRLKTMLHWAYLFQISRLIFPDDFTLNKNLFTLREIDFISEWAHQTFPELNK